MEQTAQIQMDDVTRIYRIGWRDFPALQGVSLTIERGEFAGFVGPSGSGKTTLLNLVGGLDRPTEGRVMIDGETISDWSANQLADLRNRRIGFVFQTYNLLPVYTAYENVEFPLLLQGGLTAAEMRERVLAILDKVGLGDKLDKRPATLSGGECQRVAIARAMVKNPDIVLADEPTANLDSENSHAILRIMQELNAESGTTFLFSTHDEKVMKYLKRTIRLIDGRISGTVVPEPETTVVES